MGEAKIDVKIGNLQFSGEGEPDWVAKQLDKILAKFDSAAKYAIEEIATIHESGSDPKSTIAKLPLAAYLSKHSATSNQVKKFLVTAIWLQAKGKKRLSTGDVTSALRDANQGRLGNPSDALLKNIGKGLCEKDGKQFFVTELGQNTIDSK